MKNRLPDDVKQQCLWIVRGHERREQWYKTERQNILNSSSSGFTTYQQNGIEYRQYAPPLNGYITDIPYIKTLQLDKLENSVKAQQVRAVNNAIKNIGIDIENKKLREKLVGAIILNCKDRHKFPYERLDLYIDKNNKISRSAFFRQKDNFFYEIANCLHIV